jgi:hypothetical protein
MGTSNLTEYYANKHKKSDYFDDKLRQMERHHGATLENAHFSKKQGYINDRIRNLEG